MLITNVNVVLPDRILVDAGVRVSGNEIEAVGKLTAHTGETAIDGRGGYLAPGFIELHMHLGYLGPEFPPEKELAICAENLPARGTTRFLGTLISALAGNLVVLFEAIRQHQKLRRLALCIGVHLEGPYIAEEALGGFLPSQITTPERFDITPTLDLGRDLIRTMTLSPELPGILPVIRECTKRGIVIGLGHTKAGEAVYRAAREAGASHITHCYNNRRDFPTVSGGRGFNLDDLGVADDDVTCELICDGVHVHPVWVKTIYRTKGSRKICLITDSFNAGRALADGETFQSAGGQTFVVRDGVGRDAAGGLSGSVLTQDRVRTFMALSGATLHEAIAAASLAPASVLGIDGQTGSIEAGKLADLVLLDGDLKPTRTWVEGQEVFHAADV